MSAWRNAFQSRSLRVIAGATALVICAWMLCPKPSLYPETFAFSRVLQDQEGRTLHLALTPDGKYRLHTALPEISSDMQRATLALEDQHFFDHPGVNPLSMLRAAWGVVSGSRRGGGSTVTMQLARLRWGLRTTTPWGKVWQMLRALQLERHYGKRDILEAYFNMAPYGGNVEGIGAASLLWCGKSAHELNLREAVALSVLPQSPARRKPVPGANAAQSAAALRLWQRLGEREDALNSGYALRPDAVVPRAVPHLARRLFKEHPNDPMVRCTVNLDQQHALESVLDQFLDRRKEIGIVNGAALLVHAPTREVRAYLGSAEFLDKTILGQNDGITARRSPGSALKPFVYGLALQQGLIHPRTLVRDGRIDYADYSPENFDREFTGPITAAEALFRSRNIPAVTLAQRLTAPGFYGFLKTAGVRLPNPETYYGLSLALGGEEVSMEEVASLYALLADDGAARSLNFCPQTTAKAAAPAILSPEARYLVREMLQTPPGTTASPAPGVAWKTGTSHGFRDAWAAGMFGDYVLVVWLGNFDGKGNASLVARSTAAPLLFQMIDRLNLPRTIPLPPLGVAKVELCAVSGQLPGVWCQHRVNGWFIPGVSPVKSCDVHREVLLDADTGLRIARDDGTRKLRREVCEFWPPDLMDMFKQAGLPRREPPAWAPGEAREGGAVTDAAPRIVSPIRQRSYTLSATDAARQSIPLRADAAAGVKQIFWFADKQYLGTTAPARPLMWKANAGTWKLHVLDDHGRGSVCEVTVERQ